MGKIEIKNVTKTFGKMCALDDVSINFENNKIYGLLVRNGAGKSTLLNIISNRIFADSGEVYLDGDTVTENDKALGQMFLISEKTYYPETMKVKEAFRWSKYFYPNFDETYAKNIAERFELNINKSVKSLSTGFLSIFKLVIALSVNTPYVFLDEPVLGLDANNRDLFYRILLEKYTENPFTVVLSTHLIEEITSVIEEIIIIKKGKIIRNESRESLMQQGHSISGSASAVDAYIAGKNVIGMDSFGALKTAYLLEKPQTSIPEGLEMTNLDLQKLFVQLTNS